MAKSFLSELSIVPVVTQGFREITCKESSGYSEYFPGTKNFQFEIKAVLRCSGPPPPYEEVQKKILELLGEIEF